MTKVQQSPLARQYDSIKAKYPDAILMFKVGDFYEVWNNDAIKVAGILGITSTRRGVYTMAAVKSCDMDEALPRLVRAGHRVALCEQITENTKQQTI